MKNFFKLEEFDSMVFTDHNIKQVKEIYCNYANKKLNALIKSSTVVYSKMNKTTPGIGWWREYKSNDDTEKAILVCIEKIEREPCEHNASWNTLKTSMSVDVFDNRFAHVDSVCIDCGVKLTANWIARNE